MNTNVYTIKDMGFSVVKTAKGFKTIHPGKMAKLNHVWPTEEQAWNAINSDVRQLLNGQLYKS